MFNPKEVFESTKSDLIQTLQNATFENIMSKKELVDSYFTFFESMNLLMKCKSKDNEDVNIEASNPEITETTNFVNQEYVSKNTVQFLDKQQVNSLQELNKKPNSLFEELLIEEENSFKSGNQSEHPRPMYRFERKLVGGYIPDIDGFVPEGIVRKLELHHHDYIYAKEITKSFGEPKKYMYEFAKRDDNPEQIERVQISYCKVESYNENLFIRESMEAQSNKYFLNNPKLLFELQPKDIEWFKIKEGDFVDIAFYRGNEKNCKVIWIHRFEPELEKEVIHVPKLS
ncbi:hypothetical protein SMD22_01280 (plasmid) [Brevibacillus halotolerans]|nr:hypothetical protein SMD22_01280 [Brevibacillus halotolerans]